MRRKLRIGILSLAALAALPLRARGAQAECLNAASSFTGQRNEPVAGDEAFFKLPTGPGNVMFLYDQSGSMFDIPQCPNQRWGSGVTCRPPSITAPSRPTGNPVTVAVAGTCAPGSQLTGTYTWDLRWMDGITPQDGYADPGRSNSLLTDAPHWGNGCVGDFCLFDPKAYYFPDDWSSGTTADSNWAIRSGHDDPAATGLPGACIAVDPDTGLAYTDVDGRQVDLGDACRTCMNTRGFYFYSFHFVSRRNALGVADRWNGDLFSTAPAALTGFMMKGTFLNANPPKYVAARKAVKDVAFMNDLLPSKFDQVRMGLTILDSSGTGNRKARLVVPLGPDKTTSFPPTQTGFRQARQAILSVMNQDRTVYSTGTGQVIIDGNAISGGFFDPTDSFTPLASALFNTGQYFTTPGFYTSTFGSASWEITSFGEKRSGLVLAPWVTGDGSSGQQNTCSICWACQNNSVILITDGMPNNEITLPSAVRNYDTAVYNLAANCGSQTINGTAYTCSSSNLPRMASWLHNTDLRTDMSTGGKQAITVHTISFAITDETAKKVLRATANMGGGIYQTAATATQLADAVYNAVNQVVAKENSFSAASANSLQTVQTASSEAFLTRFKPNQTNTWEGHLFQGALFDEFLNGCDPTKLWDAQPTVKCGGRDISANFNQDQDSNGNAVCTGVFLIDQDCDEIAEDPQTGDFVKRGTGTPANFPWDAGQVLSDPTKSGYRSANESAASKRNIFTWLNGAKVDLTTANVAVLKPFMNIGTAWCNALLTQIGVSGGTDPTTECAKQVIHFVRGWDVLNGDGDSCWGPSNPKNLSSCPSGLLGEERDRRNDSRTTSPTFFKLGDIFHSSPAVVSPPIDEIRCDTGYEKQCVATIHSPPGLSDQTPNPRVYTGATSASRVEAYERYRLDNITRRRVALVGANDGMLHAFDAGAADTSKPADVTGSYSYTTGNGEELWAFVPPDLLPKLQLLLGSHQYMVDGSVMLRDVWVDHDGSHSKQRNEFHTLAIFGERSGGRKYIALDVTDPVNPTMLWSFPRDGSPESLLMGQTWSDFAPRPPPIGPVRLASSSDSRGWEERWIVMLNGGYDPALGQGRAVFMVDAWTGATLWRYADADFKTGMGFDKSTSMFPVPAAVALVDLGDPSKANMDLDGFFDTATWGDLGGNLFVARFHEPGKIEASTGRVGNWFAARAFEQQRQADDRQGVSGRSEFFFMAANAFEPTTRTLRTYLGSGNRERMMDQTATCGADNLMGCCRAGCNVVSSSTVENYGACQATADFACDAGYYVGATSSTAACSPATSCAGPVGSEYTSTTTLHWDCPGAGAVPDAVGTATCDLSGVCSSTQVGSREVKGTFSSPPRNRFYGLWSYGRDPKKMFSTAAEARIFDQNRFTDIVTGLSCAGPKTGSCKLVETTWANVTYDAANPSLVKTTCSQPVSGQTDCKAVPEDAGWFYEYGNNCPLKTCGPPPPWSDEKTGSGATVVLGCASWGGFRPVGAATSTDPCTGSVGAPVTYGYVAHYVSGIPSASCGYADSGYIARAAQRSTTAPPTAATVRVTFSPTGEISYSTLQIDAGAAPGSKTMGTRTEIGEPVYWLEVPRQMHLCRHVAGSGSCE